MKGINDHEKHKKAVTITAVKPEGRFGAIDIGEGNRILKFNEKPKGDGAWINGGFFVCEPGIFDYIKDGDQTVWERNTLEEIAGKNELFAYKHTGYWKPMDTLRDKMQLEEAWNNNEAPWKVWR